MFSPEPPLLQILRLLVRFLSKHILSVLAAMIKIMNVDLLKPPAVAKA